MMATVTVTAKGRITIPASVRASMGIEAGSRIEFVEIGKRQFAIIPLDSPVGALKGSLRIPSSPISIEQMNEAIASHAARAR